MAFEVASVRQNKSNDAATSNVALGPGDYYSPNGGLFRATNYPLIRYIAFAYKVNANQLQALMSQLPKWVLTDRFDIEARAQGNPTKDQMRLMIQSVLVDRFKLAIHSETRQLPVFALVLAKPGKTGPQLQAHPDGVPCSSDTAQPTPVASGLPMVCGGIQSLPPSALGLFHFGGRNVTMELIASSLAIPGGADRPVLNQTGLGGTFDVWMEYAPQLNRPQPPTSAPQPYTGGPTFLEALQEQLGLKLVPMTGPVDVLVIDHIEEPSPN